MRRTRIESKWMDEKRERTLLLIHYYLIHFTLELGCLTSNIKIFEIETRDRNFHPTFPLIKIDYKFLRYFVCKKI